MNRVVNLFRFIAGFLFIMVMTLIVMVAVTVAFAGIACANLMYGSLKGALVGAAVVGGAGGAAVVVCGGLV
jgi:hypothetical protein